MLGTSRAEGKAAMTVYEKVAGPKGQFWLTFVTLICFILGGIRYLEYRDRRIEVLHADMVENAKAVHREAESIRAEIRAARAVEETSDDRWYVDDTAEEVDTRRSLQGIRNAIERAALMDAYASGAHASSHGRLDRLLDRIEEQLEACQP